MELYNKAGGSSVGGWEQLKVLSGGNHPESDSCYSIS